MSVSAATPVPAPAPVPPVPRLPDFSERLSPMLVKELRQGMRSPVFVWGLIVMNLFLAVIVWLTMLDPGEDMLHQAFFGAYCALVCGLLPLRAAGALHDELRGNTIDTLILTKLTGWRIALGKWVAVVAQQGLAAITVLPYLIVRYFAGGLNVPMELAWLGIFLLAGMGSAAILTGFSWIKYFLFRAAIMMGMTLVTGIFCAVMLDEMFGYRRQYLLDEIFAAGGWQFLLLMLVPAMHLSFFALDLGASKVGSMVENRAVRRRLTGAGVIAFYLAMALAWHPHRGYSMEWVRFVVPAILAGVTLLVLGCQALLEQPLNLAAVVQPMVKRGRLGRIAGRFLYPGWPSGVCYTFAMLLLGLLLVGVASFLMPGIPPRYATGNFPVRDIAYLVAGPGALMGLLPVPLVIWQLFFRNRLPWHLGIYSLLLLGVAAVQFSVIAMASSLGNQNLLKWGLPIPTMSWVWLAETNGAYPWKDGDERNYIDWDYEMIAKVSASVTLSWWLLALLMADRAFRATRTVEREAQALLRRPRVAAAPVEEVP